MKQVYITSQLITTMQCLGKTGAYYALVLIQWRNSILNDVSVSRVTQRHSLRILLSFRTVLRGVLLGWRF